MINYPGMEVVKDAFEKRLPLQLKLYYKKETHNLDYLNMIT